MDKQNTINSSSNITNADNYEISPLPPPIFGNIMAQTTRETDLADNDYQAEQEAVLQPGKMSLTYSYFSKMLRRHKD